MAHSIELLPDAAGDAVIRDAWRTLADAGLPSAGSTTAETNRPHCTLLAANTISPEVATAMATLVARLPLDAVLGPPAVLPSGDRYTLAAGVVPNSRLLSTQATAVRFAGGFVDHLLAHCDPGSWTPHLTLARRLDVEQLSAALELLDWDPTPIRFSSVRRWDGDTKTEYLGTGFSW
ncbi:MAG: 2'-5' RNA ligase family protein [Gordonia sp. (in: high G+C Gram-positive bacteria)]|uniref:2'-5' RNA ligase family protein n=1 Tax=Gordonia sp. (in: high G+C Gram-positive bacteria) TaxID=84139 RepID=UPI0039E639BB